MSRRTIIKRSILVVLIAALAYGVRYAWVSFPIISGFGAKNLCSCMFVGGRSEKSVKEEELADSPLPLGKFVVDEKDSSVTGTVFGLAKRKAIYRKGLGCTLVNDVTETAIRSQHFATAVAPSLNTDTITWPSGDAAWEKTEIMGHFANTLQRSKRNEGFHILTDVSKGDMPAGINRQQLQQAVQSAFEETDPKKKIITRAVVVVYDGKLVAEQYAPGYDKHSKMLGWSMGKSITAALIGILVKEGKLNTAAPAPVPEWQDANDPRHAITLENLLQQTSGLNYVEDYTKASEATDMLFKKGDMAAYVAGLPAKDKPGTLFYYSSGNSNILSRIIRATTGEAAYHQFPAKALFFKIGMYNTILEPDASGTFVGSSYPWATARDWARFGLLYLNDGVWNGERILPEGWVQKTRTPVMADKQRHYGYQFWMNGVEEKDPAKHIYPGVPTDMYNADGYGGQEVYIIPSRKLVIVRLGLHKHDEMKLLTGILNALPH